MDDKLKLREAREEYIKLFREKAAELKPLMQRIQFLDQDIGDSTDVNAILSEGASIAFSSESASAAPAPASGKQRLRPDEFVGMTYSAAAKTYLEKIGHAVPMEELLEALGNGGCPVKGATPKKTLYISLVRAREFIPIPGKQGYLGLRKFYDGNKKGKAK